MSDYRAIFEAVISDPRYQRNVDWGAPRPGHPEGTIRAHIADLDRNVDALRPKLSEPDYWRLRVLVHSHDTFKGVALPEVAIKHPQSHASLARAFLASHCDDQDLLAMVQFHDEPYALWRQFKFKGEPNQKRLEALLSAIRDWNLFLAFLIVDGCTEGKGREPLVWFLKEVCPLVSSSFTTRDIL